MNVTPDLLGKKVKSILFYVGDDEKEPDGLPPSTLLPIPNKKLEDLEEADGDMFEYGHAAFLDDLEELIDGLESLDPDIPVIFSVG